MKAALCKSLDGPDSVVIEEIDDPVPGEGEVLVRVRAAALNFFDALILRGKYQFKPALPFSPGSEAAGDIEKVGPGVKGFKAGDRVICYGFTGGAVREKLVAKIDTLIPLPTKVGYDTGAGVTVTYGTGYYGLKDRGQLKAGETLAVLGASGGAGLAAVELGRRMGAKVIACASTTEKLAVCKQHGAEVLINYETEDLKEALRKATGGKGVDVVYDCVGDKYAEPAIRAMAWNGRFLVIGFAAGQIPKIPLNLTLLKSCDIRGVFWGESLKREPDANRENMAQVLSWLADGSLKLHIGATYPMARIVDALKAFEARAVTGKLIITI
jgi:NADPH:quinone reductase